MVWKPNRRWFRFSVRALLVAVTILCAALGWVGLQASAARERLSLIKTVSAQSGEFVALEKWDYIQLPYYEPHRLSFLRMWLGDKLQTTIHLDYVLEPELMARLEKAFPESDIRVHDGKSPFEYRPNVLGIPTHELIYGRKMPNW